MRGLVGTILLLLAGGLSVQAADPADVAFDAGDYDHALDLYDQRLTGDPGDFTALFRSAMLLSWQSRFEEAIERYDRALELRPGDSRARLERAKVLSWDGRYSESADAFSLYLDDHPGDLPARLALGNCLSWSRRFGEARQQFDTVLRDQPDNLDAVMGTARTYAWNEQRREAKVWFEKVLELDPDNTEAQTGLARVYLGAGDVQRARDQSRKLEREKPGDEEVAQLATETRRATAPSIVADLSRIEDSEDNRLDTLRLTGSLSAIPRVGLDLGYAHYDMANDLDPLTAGQATNNSFWVTFGMRPTLGQSVGVSLGVDFTDNTLNDRSFTNPFGRVDYTWGLDRRWSFVGAVGREPLRYDPLITSNNIIFDYLGAVARGRVAERWRVFAEATTASYNDGNDRTDFTTGFGYAWPIEHPRLELGYAFRYLNFSESTFNGYFDPQDFTSNLVSARVNGTFGKRRYTWRAALDTGFQSFTLNGSKAENNWVAIFDGALGFPIHRAWVLEVYASAGNYAGLTAGGFTSRLFGLQVRWRGGPR